jgi:hypothetical protein
MENEKMIDPQVAWDKLSNFETSEELKDYFKSVGIKGVVGHAQLCPIATWLKQTTGWDMVTVAGSIKFFGKMYETKQGHVQNDMLKFNHTKATEEFVHNFDHVYYPELVDPDKHSINESGEMKYNGNS